MLTRDVDRMLAEFQDLAANALEQRYGADPSEDIKALVEVLNKTTKEELMDKYALDEKARKQVAAMLTLQSGAPAKCKRCGRAIWYVMMQKSGKANPFTDDAVSHFVDCPAAAEFRRDGSTAKAQEAVKAMRGA